MKLRNKKTGEIIEVLAKISFIKRNDNFIDSEVNTFDSLAKLNENWEDYEEPKECWYIDWNGEVQHFKNWHFSFDEDIEQCKQIGNYFETKEEAQEALNKLKALKRLKDKGLLIGKCTRNQTGTYSVLLSWDDVPPARKDVDADMRLVFGGEE